MNILTLFRFLIGMPQSVTHLKIPHLNFEFANVFHEVHLPNVIHLDLDSKLRRKRNFDDNEIKALAKCFINLKSICINNAPVDNYIYKVMMINLNNIEELSVLRAENIDDISLNYMGKYCMNLKKLSIGGSPKVYNTGFTYIGIQGLFQEKIKLESICIEYCTKIGDESIEIISNKCQNTLQKFCLIRNSYEKCCKISDKAISYLKQCTQLTHLTFNYVRKFAEEFPVHLSKLINIKYLNFTECPILEDLSILSESCPVLEEINLSGDSWVRKIAILGLSKHKNLRVLHLGHLEHGESQCDKDLGEYPPKGIFIESLFKKPEYFPNLRVFYLEQACGLTYWLDIRIKKIRPKLELKYTIYKNELDFNSAK